MKSTSSIKLRLVKGLMLIVLFFLVQAGLVWYAISNARSTFVESTHKNTVATSELGSLAVLAQQIRRYEKEYFVWVGNKEKRESYEREWRDALGKIDAVLEKIKTGSDGAFTAKDIKQAAAWSDASAFYGSEMQKIFLVVAKRSVMVNAGKEIGAISASAVQADAVAYRSDEVNEMIKAGKDRFSADLIKGVAAMSQAKSAETLALAGIAEEMFNNVLTGIMVTVAIGVIVALMLSVSLPRAVRKSIDGLAKAAEEMSMGNLNQEYDAGGVTEFTRLAEALNRMRLGQLALVERLQKRQ